jgi:opacity protein-like surface antigen
MTRASIVAALLLLVPASSRAQNQFSIRGFGDAGLTVFTATQSFKAILGKPSGPVFGGGVEAGLSKHLFLSLAASRFRRTGHRVFVFEDQVFNLNVADTITITPLELTAGYRFRSRGRSRIVPYAGLGVGWLKYEDTAAHSTAADDAKTTHAGYHLLGGAEIPLEKWLAAAVDAQWSSVPNGFGDASTGVAGLYHEHDLGGFTLRAKIILGR